MKNRDSFNIPILFILFNRPDLAAQTFERIRLLAPDQLYVAIDGARVNNANDIKSIDACKALINTIDWPCTVQTLFRDKNLGCKLAVSSAISWFFNNVEAGIILEDDCLPDLTFFDFCRIMLDRYAYEPSVMHIGGANLYKKSTWGTSTYFFSSIPHIWGWATWRRAWQYYSVDMKGYIEFEETNLIQKVVTYKPSVSYWKKVFADTCSGVINTWDYQWVFTIWKYQGLCIIPNRNLISNIGFGESATHTLSNSEFANLPTTPIEMDRISHPALLAVNREAVNYAFAKYYSPPSRLMKIKSLFSRK